MAALERLEKSENDAYQYVPPTEEELAEQRSLCMNGDILFSILVPVYCTPEKYFKEMVQSVMDQSYPNWELLLGDASPDSRLQKIAEEIGDTRVKYIRIAENKGISANTNVVLKQARGQYIGLLDHDDVLAPDALFMMYRTIKECEKKGAKAGLIYSDEDKGDGEMVHFYDVNTKPAFDQDYLWSNNYICHFTVMEAELMKSLEFRTEYDGAQDYDIILRAVRTIEKQRKSFAVNSQVLNISKVLYHWRCHTDSTAVNPQSKLYAYEAGKRAVEEDLAVRGIKAHVSHSKHLGFYRVDYEDVFRDRPEVAAVAGPVYQKGRIERGAKDSRGQVLYKGLRKGFSGGHLHKAGVWQQCAAADFEHMVVRTDAFFDFLSSQDLRPDSIAIRSKDFFVDSDIVLAMEVLSDQCEEEMDRLCTAWANYVHARNMVILYDPELS